MITIIAATLLLLATAAVAALALRRPNAGLILGVLFLLATLAGIVVVTVAGP